jgi:23S rRNA (pseudouridine1915-N3)-methyltransferase
MRVTLAAIGRLKAGPDRELFARYWDRLEGAGRKIGVAPVRLVELPESKAAGASERKADEASRLLKAIGDTGMLVALDETGKSLTSVEFARLVGRCRDGGETALSLVIGGPDGHGPDLLQRAKIVLNLGTMTLPHGLARIVLAEQLYRATTILSGHPYHRS